MHEILEDVCHALDALTSAVAGQGKGKQLLIDTHGWHHPALTRQDISLLSYNLAEKIRHISPQAIDDNLIIQIESIPEKLNKLQTSNIPHLFNGNAHQALPAYIATLNWVEKTLEPLLTWQIINDSKAMPAHIARRIRSLQDQLEQISPDMENLQSQVHLINNATEAAESLPTDLKALQAARDKVDQLATSSTELYSKINTEHQEAKTSTDHITQCRIETDKLVKQCEEAYHITTTKGLAAAFDQRASSLAWSLRGWVIGLLFALAVGAYIGSHRLELLSAAINTATPQWGVIWMQAVLSMLSIGAPLWFAWMATKQIGQRFRLAEDYAFKASVAKAYEGYRKEAARIDEAFEARLFSSALTRLEEAPLRLMEQTTHGSPWHELITSEVFRKAMDQIPELKDQFIEITKTGISSIKSPSALLKSQKTDKDKQGEV
ncbi:MAG: hypothetical protein PHE17_05460 [Thiothrix sp.]|uniref:hypothetical protein n=1 Tax=Thiothrix sp. TaxID=1032 RepID=UPI0026091D2C|nr:hypothetical protein [Thiothrix sp.]MDD5392445.1 hypothetical protein [Thiothrix sp.]